jgi:hypothetical protein
MAVAMAYGHETSLLASILTVRVAAAAAAASTAIADGSDPAALPRVGGQEHVLSPVE